MKFIELLILWYIAMWILQRNADLQFTCQSFHNVNRRCFFGLISVNSRIYFHSVWQFCTLIAIRLRLSCFRISLPFFLSSFAVLIILINEFKITKFQVSIKFVFFVANNTLQFWITPLGILDFVDECRPGKHCLLN